VCGGARNSDAFTRMSLQEHLLEIWHDDRPTMLFVTHDIDEALMLADRVIVLLGRPGQIRRTHGVQFRALFLAQGLDP